MAILLNPAQRAVGAVVESNGQIFEAVGERLNTRPDGSRALLLTWRASCAECGQPFEFSSLKGAIRWTPSRRCPDHRRPGVPSRFGVTR
jgi:hypothetical protein